jgi:8-oxo-dGTP diphosphatase
MKTLVVSAAVVERRARVLVTRRPKGVHLEGLWEFPGGKCEPGETLQACLEREMLEELNVGVAVGPELLAVAHDYPDRRVELHFLRCELLGEPAPQLGQDLRWVAYADLDPADFPPADAELIRRLRSPAAP